MTKTRLSQHVQKAEHINWGWFGILHVTFSSRIHKVREQNIKDLHLLCHLMWPRWFNFLVHDLSVYILLDFASLLHMLFAYKVERKNDKKLKKVILPTYLSYFFFLACNPKCCTQMYFHAVESVWPPKKRPNIQKFHQFCLNLMRLMTAHSSELAIF